MKKVGLNLKNQYQKHNRIDLKKGVQLSQTKTNKLERSPMNEYFDFSTEAQGFYTRKDGNGNILQIVRAIFPR